MIISDDDHHGAQRGAARHSAALEGARPMAGGPRGVSEEGASGEHVVYKPPRVPTQLAWQIQEHPAPPHPDTTCGPFAQPLSTVSRRHRPRCSSLMCEGRRQATGPHRRWGDQRPDPSRYSKACCCKGKDCSGAEPGTAGGASPARMPTAAAVATSDVRSRASP